MYRNLLVVIIMLLIEMLIGFDKMFYEFFDSNVVVFLVIDV